MEKTMEHLKIEKMTYEGCKLNSIFQIQKQINSKYYDVSKLNLNDRVFWSMRLFIALIVELVEFLNWLPWKWWANKKDVKTNEVKFELIDCLHFLISLCLLWGMDENDVYDFYCAKASENFKRQETSYDG